MAKARLVCISGYSHGGDDVGDLFRIKHDGRGRRMCDAGARQVPDTGGGGVPAAAEEEDGGVLREEERAAKEWVLPAAGSGVCLRVDAEEGDLRLIWI